MAKCATDILLRSKTARFSALDIPRVSHDRQVSRRLAAAWLACFKALI